MYGLRGSFEDGDALLEEAHALGGGLPAVDARIDLERGRLRRSSGDPEAARPLFESAYSSALESEQHFLAADAAHMVALVAGDRDGFVEWTQRGIELAERHESASYWRGPLLNNLGWEYYDAGEFARGARCVRAGARRARGGRGQCAGDRDRAVRRRKDAPRARPRRRRDPAPRASRCVGGGAERAGRVVPRGARRGVRGGRPRGRRRRPGCARHPAARARRPVVRRRRRALRPARGARVSLERNVAVLALRRGLAL